MILCMPLQVGSSGKESIGYKRDDEGENISSLNPFFCELTGVYWAWKNIDADFIGLVHYRRYFSVKPHAKNLWQAVLKQNDIELDLEKIKIFVPKKRKYYIETLYSHYAHTHHIYQLDEVRRILYDRFPDYIDSFDRVMNRNWGYMFNMMIMEKDIYNDYCTWLFDILFELKERLGEHGLTPFHSRYYGRISEIIFNVWLEQNMKVGIFNKEEFKEIPVIHMEKINWKKKSIAFLNAKFFGKKYEGSF